MSIQTALVAIKSGDATLNALIGTRFYPDALPQNVTLPAVRFQVISRPRDYTMGAVPDIAHPRVQLDGYVQSRRSGGTAGARETLAAAIRSAFNRYDGTIGGVIVQDIRIENEIEGIEMLGTNTEADRVTIDMILDISE